LGKLATKGEHRVAEFGCAANSALFDMQIPPCNPKQPDGEKRIFWILLNKEAFGFFHKVVLTG